MLVDREDTLLFIVPLTSDTTIVGYTSGRVQLLDIPMQKYFKIMQVKRHQGYKAPIQIKDNYLYPTTAIKKPECCWIHVEIMCGQNILEYEKILRKYTNTVSVEKIIQIYKRMIQDKQKNDNY